ncbi:MAG: hypothetical protein HZB56_10285 [Deltaproteobacteria bacterium]|nr:hypothetical protein [Deltaproteobacteria bacterium]
MIEGSRSPAQQAASRRNGATSRGPTSPEGRARAALNSIRHGLAAKHLLLGGEDQARYEAHVESWFVALGPENDAQAEVAALAGDVVWRLQRLQRIEDGLLGARVEELVEQSDLHRLASRTRDAVAALGALVAALRDCPVAGPRTDAFAGLLAGARALAEHLDGLDGVPLAPLVDMQRALELLADVGLDPVPQEPYHALRRAAEALREQVGELAGRQEDALAQMRRDVLARLALPDGGELTRLGRYRKQLEESLARLLAAFEKLKALSAVAGAAEPGRARDYAVRLRIVS